MKILRIILLLTGLLLLTFFLGPQTPDPVIDSSLPSVDQDLLALEQSIARYEQSVGNIKPDNHSRIVWADSVSRKTEYSVVYLPGFTATYAEGRPINLDFARRYGCNLYLPRLYKYGLQDEDAFADFSTDSLVISAAHAVAVGRKIGEKVILMSSSTGSTLSLILAAAHPEIAALITYSPNIAIYDSKVSLLTGPWGLQLGRMVTGSQYRQYEQTDEYKKYWYTRYRLEGVVALQALLEKSMVPETFSKVSQPLFLGYYYKNEEEMDKVVSVPAMLDMYEQISTPDSLKRKVAFPGVGHHALASYLTSKDLESVRRETFRFAEEVLGLEPQNLPETVSTDRIYQNR